MVSGEIILTPMKESTTEMAIGCMLFFLFLYGLSMCLLIVRIEQCKKQAKTIKALESKLKILENKNGN